MNRNESIGVSIGESLRFVSSVAAECEALLKTVKDEVSRMLLQADMIKVYSAAGDWILSYEEDETGWISMEVAASLALQIKSKRLKDKNKASGHAFIQISLAGCGTDALNNREPLIYVGWWHEPITFGEIQMGFPIDVSTDYQLKLEEGALFRWTHKAAPDEWCYVLRLTDVNTLQDAIKLIVTPLKRLLLGDSINDALDSLPIVRFLPAEGDSDSQQFTAMPR